MVGVRAEVFGQYCWPGKVRGSIHSSWCTELTLGDMMVSGVVSHFMLGSLRFVSSGCMIYVVVNSFVFRVDSPVDFVLVGL